MKLENIENIENNNKTISIISAYLLLKVEIDYIYLCFKTIILYYKIYEMFKCVKKALSN